jgi:muconolactone delta-isomerase
MKKAPAKFTFAPANFIPTRPVSQCAGPQDQVRRHSEATQSLSPPSRLRALFLRFICLITSLVPTLAAKPYAAEAIRAKELAKQGIVKRLWRVPSQKANWGLWMAEDATTLHQAISSLPLYPYMEFIVHPLAKHSSDPLGNSEA